MRTIDIETWPRRKHFEFFSAFDYPHIKLCANVDITTFHRVVTERGISFTVPTIYILSRVANEIEAYRYRIRGETVVEHEAVHPSPTILIDEDLFSFCTMKYSEDFTQFARQAEEAIARVKADPTLEDEPGQDDLLYMTAIPWVSFTNLMHPVNMHPVDSVPRIAWGKFFKEGDRLKMPVALQAHHALVDGIHLGKYFNHVEEYFGTTEELFE